MYNLYPSMKYRLGALDIIQPTVRKQLKESYARTQHLEGRTAMSETMESLEKDRQIPRNLSHPTDIYIYIYIKIKTKASMTAVSERCFYSRYTPCRRHHLLGDFRAPVGNRSGVVQKPFGVFRVQHNSK